MIALGIDPGLASLGWSLVAENEQPASSARLARPYALIRRGTVKTPPGETQPRVEALWAVLAGLQGFAVMGIENQERAWQGAQARGRTSSAATLARVGEGVARARAAWAMVPVLELSPAELRAGVALPGNATKEQVRKMLERRVDGFGAGDEHSGDATAAALAAIKVFRYRARMLR